MMGMLRRIKNIPYDATQPTTQLLQEVVVAGLTCPGFSESMKHAIILNLNEGGYGDVVKVRGWNFRIGGVHKTAATWPFHALVKQPGAGDAIIEVCLPIPPLIFISKSN